MSRYIDADKIDYTVTIVGIDENAGYRAVAFESDIDDMPTADVVPKSEDNIPLDVHEALKQRAKVEVAREIFEEIYEDCFDQFGYINYEALAELKKKYTEET